MRKKAKAAPQPTKAEFVNYARERAIDEKRAEKQWAAWDAGGWCDGSNNPIMNWKLKLWTYARNGFGEFRLTASERRRLEREAAQDRVDESRREYEERQRYKRRGDAI